MKKWGVRAVPAVLLIGASAFLLKGMCGYFGPGGFLQESWG